MCRYCEIPFCGSSLFDCTTVQTGNRHANNHGAKRAIRDKEQETTPWLRACGITVWRILRVDHKYLVHIRTRPTLRKCYRPNGDITNTGRIVSWRTKACRKEFATSVMSLETHLFCNSRWWRLQFANIWRVASSLIQSSVDMKHDNNDKFSVRPNVVWGSRFQPLESWLSVELNVKCICRRLKQLRCRATKSVIIQIDIPNNESWKALVGS